MKIIKTLNEWKSEKLDFIPIGQSIGFIPTLGGLHEGHFSLILKSKQENKTTVVSIFLNPTQFDNPEDLKKYPANLEEDIENLKKLNVDYLFLPESEYIYKDNYNYMVTEKNISKILCGAHRPGHFNGVLTVVFKLLNIIKPNKTYFGEKDYQQYLLVKNMVNSFFMDIEVISCPTIRQENGLALSSRNKRLSREMQIKASEFFKELSSGKTIPEIKLNLEKINFKVDYIEKFEDRILGAVQIEGVRLIDNWRKL